MSLSEALSAIFSFFLFCHCRTVPLGEGIIRPSSNGTFDLSLCRNSDGSIMDQVVRLGKKKEEKKKRVSHSHLSFLQMWNGRLNSLLSRISPLLSPSQTPLENCSILENNLPCSTSAARQGCERILAPPHRMVGRCRAEPSVHPAWEETTASALLFLGYGFPFLLYIILILQTPVIFFSY